MPESPHVPVLLAEVVGALAPTAGEVIVDGTFGAGGYTRVFLEKGAQVIAFDRDPAAAVFAEPLEQTGRLRLIEDSFASMGDLLGDAAADGVAFDLGVSSMQLDTAARGFSLVRDGPLDMRLGREGPTAADLLATVSAAELARILKSYGEERESRRIAAGLVRRRAERQFTRTLELAEFVERLLGGRRGARVHPATRVFQALRIAVNHELEELSAGLAAAERVLRAHGRLAVVTFHSLEDRIVKTFLAERSGKVAGGSRHAPPLMPGPPPTFELIFAQPRTPSPEELAANPRARSAKLRAARRTAAPAWEAGL
jgi:16S rRNA (cytosine1402-N4)-methyltransferase